MYRLLGRLQEHYQKLVIVLDPYLHEQHKLENLRLVSYKPTVDRIRLVRRRVLDYHWHQYRTLEYRMYQ